jgi:hypothetical protein
MYLRINVGHRALQPGPARKRSQSSLTTFIFDWSIYLLSLFHKSYPYLPSFYYVLSSKTGLDHAKYSAGNH